MIWDYRNGTILRTFLLPTSPISLALDPADRAFYAGYEDGTVQLVDFFKTPSLQNPLYDPEKQHTPSQPPASDHWTPPFPDVGAATSVTLSYDGTNLLSGHANGKVLSWDVAKGKYVATVADVASPITNLQMLPPTGFPNQKEPRLIVHHVVKPRYEQALSNTSGDGTVPAGYTFSAHLTTSQEASKPSAFDLALTHSSFPPELLAEGLAELSTYNTINTAKTVSNDQDMIMLDEQPDPTLASLRKENEALKTQLTQQAEAQKWLTESVTQMAKREARLKRDEDAKKARSAEKRASKVEEGERKRREYFEGKKNGAGKGSQREVVDEHSSSGSDETTDSG